MNNKLILGDCIEAMASLEPVSVDLVLTDPPYGTTVCKWDSVIPLDPMWHFLGEVTKPESAIVLTAIEPFSSTLVLSNPDMFKYKWIWKKSRVSHFAQAPYRPLTETEDVLVFSKGGVSKNANTRMNYFPQGLEDCNKIMKGRGHSDHRPSKTVQSDYVQTKTGYPKQILEFQSAQAKHHPTEKPVKLMEYLIKTYSKEGDTVLDFCMGSGTTGVACKKLNRNFIGIENDEKYFDIAKERIESGI